MIERSWVRTAVVLLVVLAVLAPVFALGAEAVGYAEPLDHAASATGAEDDALGPTSVFSGYTLPGLGGSPGTLGAALVGAGLTLVLTLAAGRVLEQ